MARLKHLSIFVACLCWQASLHGVTGAKIVLSMSMIMNSVSQHIFLSAVTEPLVERGHEVVLLAPKNKYQKGFSEEAVTRKIFFQNNRTKEEMRAFLDEMKTIMLTLSESPFSRESLRGMSRMTDLFTEGCYRLWKDGKMLARLKEERFDLLITMPVVGCDVLLAEYLGIPFVVVTPIRRAPTISEATFGSPAPTSYVPFNPLLPFMDRMNFWQRTVNLLGRYVIDPLIAYSTSISLRSIQLEYDIRPELSLSEIVGKAQLWLSQFHFALDFAQPIAPNFVSIGGITVKPTKPLPQDMEEFVQGSGEHGVIVFTLGSVVDNIKNDELTETFAKVFSELPQRVIWRYAGARPRNQGKNTLIADWLPQNDLLGHPKTRLLIYHGGANGVYEAVTHGVPLLLLPLAFDQMSNAVRVEAKGLGFAIDKNTLTEDSFREALLEILNNPKYAENMKRASGIVKDELVSTRDMMAHRIEHVIKFGGDHLRTRALELNFIQRNSFDVALFLCCVLGVALFVMSQCLRRCYRCACARRRNTTDVTKSKSD